MSVVHAYQSAPTTEVPAGIKGDKHYVQDATITLRMLASEVTAAMGGEAAGPHDHDDAYATTGHTHDTAHDHTGTYATAAHAHDYTGSFATLAHTHATYSATSHNHDGAYAATHAHPYAASAHTHTILDADVPSGIARDSEVTAAIAAHLSGATHGGEGASVPAGVIVMWAGLVSAIPAGWALCNGQNGTPDLRDRFIRGAAAGADPGATGGSSTHTHAAHTDVVNHTHGVTVTDPGHTHLTQRYPTATGGSSGFTIDTSMSGTPADNTLATKAGTTGISATTANPAGGAASLTHDTPNSEPPFYALAFIQKS